MLHVSIKNDNTPFFSNTRHVYIKR